MEDLQQKVVPTQKKFENNNQKQTDLSLGTFDKALIQCETPSLNHCALVAIGQIYPSSHSSTKTRKKTMNGRYKGIDKPRQDLILNTFPFL